MGPQLVLGIAHVGAVQDGLHEVSSVQNINAYDVPAHGCDARPGTRRERVSCEGIGVVDSIAQNVYWDCNGGTILSRPLSIVNKFDQ